MGPLTVHGQLPEIYAGRDCLDVSSLAMDVKGEGWFGVDLLVCPLEEHGNERWLEVVRQFKYELATDPVRQAGDCASE
jgi:hypothetical protein